MAAEAEPTGGRMAIKPPAMPLPTYRWHHRSGTVPRRPRSTRRSLACGAVEVRLDRIGSQPLIACVWAI